MLSVTELRIGVTFVYRDDPYQILSYHHHKMGRGGSNIRVKMRNLRSGMVLEETFKGGDSFDEANLEERKAQYLYGDTETLTLMDQETFDQFELSREVVGDLANYLSEGSEVQVLLFDDKPIGISLPIKVTMTIAETAPGFKGDTAARSYKPATIETGATVQVPFHVKPGDKIVIDTRTGDYVSKG
ncbi:MAG: elongation factor P [Patescibacteria group bacterium]